MRRRNDRNGAQVILTPMACGGLLWLLDAVCHVPGWVMVVGNMGVLGWTVYCAVQMWRARRTTLKTVNQAGGVT